jgi:hypothetical protein
VSATDAINWANDRIGVSEDPPGSNKGPWITQWQVDSGYPYVVNRSHGEPWCQCFVNAVAVHGGAPQLHTGFTPAVIVGIGDFRPISLSSAEPGAAFVFFKWPGVSNYRCDHVGVYKSHTYSTVTCWEGNTSKAGSQNNGGAVLLKTRSLGLLAGVVSIPYNNEAYRNLLLGMTGSDVRAFQVAINKRAVGCGRGGLEDRGVVVDGEYGSATKENGAWAAYILGIGDSTDEIKSGGISSYVQNLVRNPDERNAGQKERAAGRREQCCR